MVDGLSASIISLFLRTQIKAMFKVEKKEAEDGHSIHRVSVQNLEIVPLLMSLPDKLARQLFPKGIRQQRYFCW